MADPVIPATEVVNYVFGFANAGAAGNDLAVGQLTGQEVLLYFTGVSSVVPLAGYQPMVTRPGPVNDALYNHPKLLFAMDLKRNPPVLKTIYPAAQMAALMVVLSNYGTIVVSGLTGP
jgi:hypothetical protein